ncbi:conserved hypothetical protein [Talaromyces stipitatus ATCC 10500]|uniref:Uncharacterized protein n=1 Tax=Talaromyces stipitatus (strain ATCC 10500 / CBS 375.48 / QM 6759 / NRRL 1006) TaxID=441959 RepID=B8LZC6_TALSN|nr:uncharacterized protein TSTA_089150 [Talaromyces stipitatus ATCC 10500]EED21679.1 conserved hypothetical protein [Talaromyces stipitatus ATCC 10500]
MITVTEGQAHAFYVLKYEANRSGSSLVVPSDQWKLLRSRLNNPNHPANSGSLIIPIPGIDKMMVTTQQQVQAGIKHFEKGKSSPREEPTNGQVPDLMSRRIIKKVLQEGVLYLLAVNLPSDDEVQESVTQLEHIIAGVETTVFSQ